MGKWTNAAKEQREVYDTAAAMLTDQQALTVKGAYWQWDDLVEAGKTVDEGYRFLYGDNLYKTAQPTYTFVSHRVPGAPGTESLFSKVDESHAGTIDDPIPYEPNMEIYEGLYYIQNDVLYRCIRSSGQPLYHDLSALVRSYVEVAA